MITITGDGVNLTEGAESAIRTWAGDSLKASTFRVRYQDEEVLIVLENGAWRGEQYPVPVDDLEVYYRDGTLGLLEEVVSQWFPGDHIYEGPE